MCCRLLARSGAQLQRFNAAADEAYLATDELVRRSSQTNSVATGPWEYKAKLVYTGNPARRGERRTPLWAASIM